MPDIDHEELQRPLTEIEKAELLRVASESLNQKGTNLLHRVLFQSPTAPPAPETTTIECGLCHHRQTVPTSNGVCKTSDLIGWFYTTDTGLLCARCSKEA